MLDDDGESIGLNDKTVPHLSYFLDTITRNAELSLDLHKI